MPDPRIVAAIDRVRARLRIRAVLLGTAAGGAAATAIAVTAMVASAPVPTGWMLSAVGGLTIAVWAVRANWVITASGAAALIEADTPLDNLVVTAVELHDRPRPVPAAIGDAIEGQAAARLVGVDLDRVVSLRQSVVVMLSVMAGASAVFLMGPDAVRVSKAAISAGVEARSRGIDRVTVVVTPPAYSGRQSEEITDPVQISVIAGSRITLRVASAANAVAAELAGQPPLALERASDGFSAEWTAERSTAVAIRPAGGEARDVKFLSVIVVPDSPPVVRLPVPGKDLAIAGTKGSIIIGVEAQDDLGLASLSIEFTKASGGGESLTFTEGDVPLAINRSDGRRWSGRAEWVLDGLNLTDGDVLVYRAIARDRNPNGSPVQSEQYLIEVGRLAGAVGSGFAVPAEEKKYAISQQMVIYKTEQLIAAFKGKDKGLPSRSLGENSLPGRSLGEGWIEQNQLLGIEQRMVRAEVVFLGGGEVQDEVEEAAHSHEVAEGRLENTGRAEMLRAINFMSRAETELNAGRAPEALVLEREALKSLERAFDRRRYFLRTLPDRSRIDTTRRLTGNLTEARSWTRDRSRVEPEAALVRDRALMRDLAAAATGAPGADAALAAQIAALDPGEAGLQKAGVALATATDASSRRHALWTAMQAVSAHANTHLGGASNVRLAVDPLAGRLADELTRTGGRR